MNREQTLACLVVLFGASGTYLLLPHKHGAIKPRTVHASGAGLAGLALLLFAAFWTPPGPLFSRFFLPDLFFYVFAFSAVAAAVLAITARDPIHSALWFAAVVLATCGLFVLAGASFLAAGTVIVYAGAIIVTFLFVIMLAQMEGRASYDRASRMPFRATWTCYVLFLALLWTLLQVQNAPSRVNTAAGLTATAATRLPRIDQLGAWTKPGDGPGVAEVADRAVRPTARLADARGRAKPHVAGLGETLYTDHLITVELAGALLFAALIGALAIAAPKPPVRPNANSTTAPLTASTAAPTTAQV